jgi:hypothetical protein
MNKLFTSVKVAINFYQKTSYQNQKRPPNFEQPLIFGSDSEEIIEAL